MLIRCPRIGVDTEGDSLYSYREKVSLIQISGGDRHFIFDPLLLDTVEPLRSLFENTSVLKILHGADYDIVSLKRDFKFHTSPIFDTALAARAIGIKRFSLQDIIEKYFQIKLIKKYQKANWGLRPLSKGHLEYACCDTAYLEDLYSILKEEVQKKGRGDQMAEECRLMEDLTWNGKKFDPNDFLKVKGARLLPERSQKVLRALVTTRDRLAQERNCPSFKVVSSGHLLRISSEPPKDIAKLKQLFPNGNRAILNNLSLWIDAIENGKKSKDPLPQPERRSNTPMSSKLEKSLKHLKQWRNKQAEVEGVEPAMVLTANILSEIVRYRPATLSDLESIPLIRTWQIRRYGPMIIKAIAQITQQHQ